MSGFKDDPREVLAVLNSLGFVGITASQLKAFMKDLKMYRKVKDRERQQRKEDIKKRILDKQENMMKEIFREYKTEQYSSTDNAILSDSSNLYVDDSLVTVKIRCVPERKDVQEQKYLKKSHIKARDEAKAKSKIKKSIDPYESLSNKPCLPEKGSNNENRYSTTECPLKDINQEVKRSEEYKLQEKIKVPLSINPSKSLSHEHKRPMSAPNLTEQIQKPKSKPAPSSVIGTVPIRSVSSARSSGKSFIRPWRLYPESQKCLKGIKKSDPVTLYQKYQQEWKQISLPGEARHSTVRWAIREKMLGADPCPHPLPKKSASSSILQKKL